MTIGNWERYATAPTRQSAQFQDIPTHMYQNYQALVAATGWAAECLGLDREIGTVQRGKLADLVVVDGDPLRDITVLKDKGRIKLVMKEGKVYYNRLPPQRVTSSAG